MPNTHADVLIIGGGPAGSTAAAFARQRGLSVLLFEKETFPRFRIGESLLPHGNALLRESGVWPAVERAGFVRKYGALFATADGAVQKEVLFSDGIVRGLESTFQVERSRFDALLLDHARALGAEVRTGHTVVTVRSDPGAGAAEADIRRPDGSVERVTARWILDAAGREHHHPSGLKQELDPPRLARRVAVYSHFLGVPRAPGRAAGHTVVVRLEQGWFWLIPISEEKTSVGLVAPVEALRRAGGDAASFFQQEVARSAKLRDLMAGATATQPFRVTADYSYFRRRLAGPRELLLGDAGGFLDPIFSSGVYVALYSARRAVELVARAHAEGRALNAGEQSRYTRTLKHHAGVFEALIRAFYDNDSFAVFMSPRPPLRIDRGVNSIVAGHARLTWPIWWRLKVFLLVCRLQKRLPLARPIAFGGPD